MLEEATLQVHYDQGSHAPLRHRRYLSNPLREALNHVDWNASFISSIPFNEMGSMVSGNKYSAVYMYNKKVHTWNPWADPDGGTGVGTPPPPEKSQRYRVSLQNWSGSPEKSQIYQASIQ